jgi:hypothetical protein
LCIKECYWETNFLEGIPFDTPCASNDTKPRSA